LTTTACDVYVLSLFDDNLTVVNFDFSMANQKTLIHQPLLTASTFAATSVTLPKYWS